MNNQTTDPSYTQQEIDYFVQKFNITPEQVKQAIQKIGDSSENLEQYFSNYDLSQSPGSTGSSAATPDQKS